VTWYFAVDVAWTWSKRQDLADQLRSRVRRLAGQDQSPVEDRQVSARTTARAAVPKRVADRLGEATVRELIEARRVGAKLRDLADLYRISESSVKRVLRAHASRECVSELGVSGVASNI
jgi:response regulator of citrate/malate metabolism